MIQAVAAANAILQGQPAPDAAVLGVDVADCAQLYLQLIIAQAQRNTQRVDELTQLLSFWTCDPLWGEVFLEYEKFRSQAASIPYRLYQQLDDSVLPAGSSSELRIALIAEWGTGTPMAQNLLAQVARHSPDVLIHLGDIYYSGTPQEVQEHFLAICRNTLGLQIPIYTLAGNHDMYSGGAPYYWLIDQIGQPASYFCLRNDDWQLLAMDTGLHDANPLNPDVRLGDNGESDNHAYALLTLRAVAAEVAYYQLQSDAGASELLFADQIPAL